MRDSDTTVPWVIIEHIFEVGLPVRTHQVASRGRSGFKREPVQRWLIRMRHSGSRRPRRRTMPAVTTKRWRRNGIRKKQGLYRQPCQFASIVFVAVEWCGRRQSPGGRVVLLADPRRRPSRSSTPDHTSRFNLVNQRRRTWIMAGPNRNWLRECTVPPKSQLKPVSGREDVAHRPHPWRRGVDSSDAIRRVLLVTRRIRFRRIRRCSGDRGAEPWRTAAGRRRTQVAGVSPRDVICWPPRLGRSVMPKR